MVAETMVALILIAGLCAAQVPESWREVREAPMHVRHLDAGVKCAFCHAGSFEPQGIAPCESCHLESKTPLHLDASKNEPRCADCHRFGKETAIEPWGCARCHTSDPMKPAAHSDQRCDTCHVAHGPRAAVECVTCHQDQHPGRDKHSCDTCHTPHAPKEKAQRDCATCHRDPRAKHAAVPFSALFDRGHQQCTDCHDAHDSKTKACGTCHEQLTSTKHEKCVDCHAPHQVAAETAKTSCARCHEKIQVEHRASGMFELAVHASVHVEQPESCATCHTPHAKKKRPPVAAACTSCHSIAARDHGLHNGKTTCAKCHDSHGFSSLPEGDAICATCHKDQVALTSKIEEHQSCETCHAGGAHRPSPLSADRSCARCHENVASSAPSGHLDCAKCHEPHGGGMRSELSCATCHLDQAKSKHGATPNGCADCHRPHGPEGLAAPPKCSSCHEVALLPGLHANSAHQSCTTCHGGHDTALPASRDTCTGCHTAQLAHQPEAKTCSSCHPFGGITSR